MAAPSTGDESPRYRWARRLRSVAHDLKSPLSSMLGYAELLTHQVYGPLTPPQMRAATTIERRTRDLKDRLEAMVDWLRCLSGELDVHLEPVDVAAVVREHVEGWCAAPPEGDPLEVRVRADVVPAARADRELLAGALGHLVANARAAASAVVQVRVGAAGGRVVVDVVDDGPGLPEVVRATLDDEGGPDRPPGSPGMGLGIALARGWVERMGGTVEFDDAPGGGTHVRVALEEEPARPGEP